MTQNNDEAFHKIMAQVQVYASSYSLVGTRFASDNQLEEADSEKLALYNMVKSALNQSPISQPKQIPEGWKLVPIDITEDMHVAAVKAIQKCTGNDDFPRRVYKAMINAAPTTSLTSETNTEVGE